MESDECGVVFCFLDRIVVAVVYNSSLLFPIISFLFSFQQFYALPRVIAIILHPRTAVIIQYILFLRSHPDVLTVFIVNVSTYRNAVNFKKLITAWLTWHWGCCGDDRENRRAAYQTGKNAPAYSHI